MNKLFGSKTSLIGISILLIVLLSTASLGITLNPVYSSAPASAEYVYVGHWQWYTDNETGGYWASPRPDITNWVIDLRSLPQMSKAGGTPEGYGIFALSQPDDSVGVLLNPGNAKKLLGFDVKSSAPTDIAWELLTQDADPTGQTFAKPLMPDSSLNMKLLGRSEKFDQSSFPLVIPTIQTDYRSIRAASLAAGSNHYLKYLGSLVQKYKSPASTFIPADLPQETAPPPSTTITDDFNRADQSGLGSSTEGWSWQNDSACSIVSNRGHGYLPNPYAGQALSSADNYAQVTRAFQSGDSSISYLGPSARLSDASNFYCSAYRDGSYLWLEKVVGGSYTNIYTYTAPTGDHTFKVTANGSTLDVFVDGVSQGEQTDTSLSSGTYAGINLQATRLITWDNFEAGDLWSGVSAPTLVTGNATSIEATTAIGNGNISNTGGENDDIRGIRWGTSTGNYSTNVTESGSFGVGTFSENLTNLPAGTTIYWQAEAHNSSGWGYGSEETFLTKPAAPTNVAASDGTSTANVTVTWTASTGATGYRVYRDDVDVSGLLGVVTSYIDDGASGPTITVGTVSASDGTSPDYVTLSITGESANAGATHTYKVVAVNTSGNSADSSTDTGYRGVGPLSYQWQRSSADSDANYSTITGGTTNPYNDAGAPVDGSGRYYRVVLDAAGAAQQVSTADRGYRSLSVGAISNTPSSYEFPGLSANNTYPTGLNYFTVTNNTGGGQAVDITISGTDITTTGYTWTLSDSAIPGTDVCGFKAGLVGGSYDIVIKKTAPYNTLISNLVDGANQGWGLQFLTPTEITNYEAGGMSGTITLTVSLP